MRCAVVREPGGLYELEDREIPTPADDEVLLEMVASGFCHSDENIREGNLGNAFPRVPGHEVIGRILSKGAAVSDRYPVGQMVGVGWHGGSCGDCDACLAGNPLRCQDRLGCGTSYDGGFSTHVVAKANALVRIPDGMDPVAAAPLLCAGITVWNALRRSGASWGDRVAIQGIGGLGHIAVKFARAMGFETIGLTRSPEKVEDILALGADHVLTGTVKEQMQQLKGMGGAKAIVTTAPSGKAMNGLLKGLGTGGRVVVVGASSEEIHFPSGQLLDGNIGIQGSVVGTPLEMEHMLRFCHLRNILCDVQTYDLDQIHQAQADLHAGKLRFRAVLLPQA